MMHIHMRVHVYVAHSFVCCPGVCPSTYACMCMCVLPARLCLASVPPFPCTRLMYEPPCDPCVVVLSGPCHKPLLPTAFLRHWQQSRSYS